MAATAPALQIPPAKGHIVTGKAEKEDQRPTVTGCPYKASGPRNGTTCHGQLTTANSPLLTHHRQVAAGQLPMANLLQGQLAAGGWRESQAGRQVSGWAERVGASGRVTAYGVFPFSHTHHC